MGPRGRGGGVGPAGLAGPAVELAGAGRAARDAARRAGRGRARPDRAVRHGRLVAGAGGHLPDGGGAAGRPGHHRPRPGGRRADRPRPDRRRRQLQVRRHGGDREPAPRLPAARSRDAGLDEKAAGARFVVVTDPGSPLSETAAAMGARAVFLADPPSAGATARCRRSAWCPPRWPAPTSARCSTRPRSWPSSSRRADNPALELGPRDGRRRRGGPGQADARRRRLGHHRLRRLGRAADRGVDRQAGPRDPARRRSSRPTRPAPRPTTRCSPSSAGRRPPPGPRSA